MRTSGRDASCPSLGLFGLLTAWSGGWLGRLRATPILLCYLLLSCPILTSAFKLCWKLPWIVLALPTIFGDFDAGFCDLVVVARM